MEKRSLKRSIGMILLGILLYHAAVFADVDKLDISQAVQNGNDVYLYVSALDAASRPAPDTLSPEQLSVSIDNGPAMPVDEAALFQTLNEGVSYTFCIDISKSVTEQEMGQIREGITNLINSMAENDFARIITVGTEITPLCEYTQDKNALLGMAQSLQRTANYTYLYKGISFALDGYRKSVATMPKRAALILFTDGMDDSDGAASEEQVLLDIAETRIPIYVVGLKGNDPAANLNSAGQIARQSGGTVYSYSDMAVGDAVQTIGDVMRNTYRLHVRPDEAAFGKQNLVWNASYNPGNYSVVSKNYVYSLGMENVVVNTPEPTPEPTAEPTPTPEPTQEPEPEEEPEKGIGEKIADFVKDNLIICIASVLVIVALIIILVIVLVKKKHRAEIKPEPLPDPEPYPAENDWEKTLDDISYSRDEETIGSEDRYDDEETVDGSQDSGLRIRFEITFDGRVETIERAINDQLVLGRGNECDVDVTLMSSSEDRKQTSRKHAVILLRPDGLYIKDQSRNKTYLNGVEVTEEIALRNEDVLQLGKSVVKVITL